MAEQPKRPPGHSSLMDVMRAMNPYRDVGMTFVVTIGGGAWLGYCGNPYWADQRWGTAPWLLFVGAVLGIAVGFYHFFAVVLRK